MPTPFTCPPCNGRCNQGRMCTARESASRAFDLPRAAHRRLVIALVLAGMACVLAAVSLPSLF